MAFHTSGGFENMEAKLCEIFKNYSTVIEHIGTKGEIAYFEQFPLCHNVFISRKIAKLGKG